MTLYVPASVTAHIAHKQGHVDQRQAPNDSNGGPKSTFIAMYATSFDENCKRPRVLHRSITPHPTAPHHTSVLGLTLTVDEVLASSAVQREVLVLLLPCLALLLLLPLALRPRRRFPQAARDALACPNTSIPRRPVLLRVRTAGSSDHWSRGWGRMCREGIQRLKLRHSGVAHWGTGGSC